MRKFPSYLQRDEKECGPACLKIILKFYGKHVDIDKLVEISETTRSGTTLLGLSKAAEKLGLKSTGARVSFNTLQNTISLPCIVFWQQKHFVIIYKIKKEKVYVSDPSFGLIVYSKEEFLQNWTGSLNTSEGIVLMLELTTYFQNSENEISEKKKSGISFLWNHLQRYKSLVLQLLFSLVAGCIIQFTFPFLTQSLVDNGIQNQNLNFIYLVLLGQLMLFLGKAFLDVIRTYILMYIGTRLQISLVSEFFIKLMKLPVSFFDTRLTGDIIQRINDHKRVEGFLTVTSLNALFSMVNLMVFGAILLFYNPRIFLIFLAGSTIFFGWIVLFQKQRKEYDYKLFSQLSNEQTKVLEIIQGMPEIKLNNAEQQKRWSWENIQAKIFKNEMKALALEQYQSVGATFINELKNIIITVVAAKLVIDGQITLGMMLSISYITGQLNGPLLQMTELFNTAQKARLSIERLFEIHNKNDEENGMQPNANSEIDFGQDITIKRASFQYNSQGENVLENIDLTIPAHKVTAIVGPSGSGKTTLLKLLLKIYEPKIGQIQIGDINLKNVSPSFWRERCGVVMQDGFIFNETIENNIAVGVTSIDKKKLKKAIKVANLEDLVRSLPLSVNTMLGAEGVGLSEGQKQRILIARAVYKDPRCLFFDEATSALDANNEKIIMDNLMTFFRNRTVVVIAHRLSTVKNADQIVLLGKSGISEIGDHDRLIKSKGQYYTLVKNQLQLERLSDGEEI